MTFPLNTYLAAADRTSRLMHVTTALTALAVLLVGSLSLRWLVNDTGVTVTDLIAQLLLFCLALGVVMVPFTLINAACHARLDRMLKVLDASRNLDWASDGRHGQVASVPLTGATCNTGPSGHARVLN